MINFSPSEFALFKHRANLMEVRSIHAIVKRYNTPEPNRWSDFSTRIMIVTASVTTTDTMDDIVNLTLKTYNQ